jgi:hypothetical protein
VIGQKMLGGQAEKVAQTRFYFCMAVGFVSDSLKLHSGVLDETRRICPKGFSRPTRSPALVGKIFQESPF